jgi:vitamin B12 transporter
MKTGIGVLLMPLLLSGQTTVSLPEFTVNSARVANQAPVGTFVMPVSALRYDPQVDIQARNLAEGQADVTLRGGIFESTGFQLGVSTIIDPQTGHYFAEIPVAPAMLEPPNVVSGAGMALGAANSTAGAIRYGWRAVRTGGALLVGFGSHHLNRAEIYQGYASPLTIGRQRLAADVAIARSESHGAVPYGEHEFNRANLRIQLAGASSQTDFFAGYQAKFFGWPNLYTPFNSNETEDLETALFSVNHHVEFGGGDFFDAGAYHRRNKDDYAFNRFAPVGPVHPFQHTTWVKGAAAAARRTVGRFTINARAEVLADELRSTSLTFGRFNSRTISKLSVVPEMSWSSTDGSRTILKAGASHDDTSEDSGMLSPVLELSREFPNGGLRRIYAGYTKTSQVATYTALNSNPSAGLFRGNPNLGRMSSHNFEGGITGAMASWTLDAALFFRADEGLVDWTFRRGVTARTANAVDVDVTGLEAVARRSWAACDLVFGYAYLAKDANHRGAVVDASFYALNYARHRFTAAFTARLGHGFEIRMDNVARIQAANLLRLVGGDDSITSSLGVVYRPAGIPGFEISAQGDNLWASDFQEVPAVPASPRQFSAGVGYRW